MLFSEQKEKRMWTNSRKREFHESTFWYTRNSVVCVWYSIFMHGKREFLSLPSLNIINYFLPSPLCEIVLERSRLICLHNSFGKCSKIMPIFNKRNMEELNQVGLLVAFKSKARIN